MTNETLMTMAYAQMALDIEEDQAKISQEDFDLVVDCTHYSGRLTQKIPGYDKERIWRMANGFGNVSLKYIVETLEWDWSHIRDSDSKAIARMATYIRECGFDKI